MMETCTVVLLKIVFAVLVCGIFMGLIRTVRGPRRADRIVGINLVGSFSTGAIALLAVLLQESWLLDICIVYCLMSFLAVVILAKISIIEKDRREEDD